MKYSITDYAAILYRTKNSDAFLALLERHYVLSWLPRILKRFEAMRQKRERILRVIVKSARPLSLLQEREICERAAQAMPGKRIKAEFLIDASLIGGFRVESDEILWRGSFEDTLCMLAARFNL